MADNKEVDKGKRVEDGRIEIIAGNTDIIMIKLLEAININLKAIMEKLGK